MKQCLSDMEICEVVDYFLYDAQPLRMEVIAHVFFCCRCMVQVLEIAEMLNYGLEVDEGEKNDDGIFGLN